MLDVLLVPIDEQVKIGLSNFRIALEKTQFDVIYKAYLFTIDDQNFEVNADLLSKALQITLEVSDHPFVTPPLENEFFLFINKLGYSGHLTTISGIRVNNMHQPWRTFMTMFNREGKNVNFAELMWEDFRFQIDSRKMMLNDDIKASTAYVEYLSKSSGTQLAKGRGVEDDVDFEETEEEDEIPLVQRQTRVVIGRQVHQESDEKALDHSKKLKGVERMSKTAEFLLQLRKAKKKRKEESILQQRPRGSSEGSGVTPKVPDWLNQKSPNEGSDISNNDENDGASDKEKAEAEKAKEEQAREDHTMTELAKIKQPENVQAKESVPEPHVKQPAVPRPRSSQTFSFVEYGNQFINDNPEVSLTSVLKELEAEVQSLVDVLVLQQKPAEQRPLLNIIPKDVPDFGKIKPEKAANQSMPKYSATPFDQATLDEYDQKEKLLKLMRKSKSYDKHPHHRALYDALMLSLIVDEDDMDNHLEEQSTLKKRRRDDQDQDPPVDLEKEKKKRKHKDSKSSKKDKDQAGSSKKDKSSSKSSKTDKSVHADETIHDVEMDARESVEEYVVDTVDPSQADASVPKRDTLFWFKQPMVKRPESPDPEWYKEPTVEYNFEQCYLALSDQLDWMSPEGDRIPHDLNKPLPSHGTPGRLTIPV
ncbi:hypothetical protein Tco_0928976, partial [Tanacetum coccineum]